jgi:CubicO group peptidase (beta-lactamase class C family)
MHRRLPIVVVLLALGLSLVASGAAAEPKYPGQTWERATSPETLGWSAEKLRAARTYSETISTAAVMIVVDGVVLDEWGETARRYNVHSIRKSFLSALYGPYVKEGKIRLSATLRELGIDDNEPVLTEVEKDVTVADLLKSRSGIYHAALYEGPGQARGRPARGSYRPGTYWYYNNWDFNALGTIFEQLTGRGVFGAFKTDIAEPLEMEDFRLEDGTYFRGPESVHPAYPFRMTARDMARFGLLFLRDGKWRGREVVPGAWVEESTRMHSAALGQWGGYGYMWWVAERGPHFPSAWFTDRVFSARGNGGHYIVVVPSLKLVVVHRVDTDRPRREVTDSQFGHLMQLILDAAPRR